MPCSVHFKTRLKVAEWAHDREVFQYSRTSECFAYDYLMTVMRLIMPYCTACALHLAQILLHNATVTFYHSSFVTSYSCLNVNCSTHNPVLKYLVGCSFVFALTTVRLLQSMFTVCWQRSHCSLLDHFVGTNVIVISIGAGF